MTTEDDDAPLPYVVTFETATLPGAGVALKITYATSPARFEARQWDSLVFAMAREGANGIARALLRETGELPPLPKAERH